MFHFNRLTSQIQTNFNVMFFFLILDHAYFQFAICKKQEKIGNTLYFSQRNGNQFYRMQLVKDPYSRQRLKLHDVPPFSFHRETFCRRGWEVSLLRLAEYVLRLNALEARQRFVFVLTSDIRLRRISPFHWPAPPLFPLMLAGWIKFYCSGRLYLEMVSDVFPSYFAPFFSSFSSSFF